MNLRYGAGLYFSSTSSKSNDYSEGSEATCTPHKRRRGGPQTVQRRCMLLCKVALGRPYVAQDAGFDPTTNQDRIHTPLRP